MVEFFHIVEEPRACSYLPHETASLEYKGMLDLTPEEYASLLSRGYRRFGTHLFRPACPECTKCRSVRILTQEFNLNSGQRRVLKKNAGIRSELHPLFVTRQHIDLYDRYHAFMSGHRGWRPQRTSPAAYYSEFLSGPMHLGKQWLYFDGSKLVGVAMMDEAADAISLVYCFYDPDWRDRSPGTFSILTQLLYAKKRWLRFAYPGYWIEESPSMSYKGHYRPREVLLSYPPEGIEPAWLTDEASKR